MALHLHSTIRSDYPFLAHPPPQKKRPVQPLPPLPSPHPSPVSQKTSGPFCRFSTFSTIASWAAHVQPGSPVSLSPCSTHRRPSLRKGRRPSVDPLRIPSASFLHIAPTPTPSIRNFKADLTTVGYTSVFLQLPNTPISASLSHSIKLPSPNAAQNISIPSPTCKPRLFTRFRSVSILRSRGRSKSSPDSPTRMRAKTAAAVAAIDKRKRAKYTMRPPPLANELALMQFVEGGNTDDNIKRVLEAQAKVSSTVGLADIYRDGNGGIWWDQDEELEYTHLLPEGDESRPDATGDPQWVTFGDNMSPSTGCVPEEDRRGSVSTQDSDLDPKYVVQPIDALDEDDLALFSSAVVPPTARKPPMPILSVPSRPRRAAQHLRKPGFLIDTAFSRPHASPRSPKFSTSSGMSLGMRPKGKARRRPAPLKLSPPSPASKRPTNSPIDAEKIRRDFIDASFDLRSLIPVTPVTPATAVSATTPVEVRARLAGNCRAIKVPLRTVHDGLTSLGMKRKPSVLNMMGLFRSAKREDVMA